MDLSQLKHILFLDIETVSQKPELDQLDERFINLWEKKTKNAKSELSPADFYKERASISAEFGRIIVIGLGYFTSENNETIFSKSIAGDNEKNILEEFNLFLEKLSGKENWKLCAHNGKEFDFPYLCRRMLINELPLPKLLQIIGKKHS